MATAAMVIYNFSSAKEAAAALARVVA